MMPSTHVEDTMNPLKGRSVIAGGILVILTLAVPTIGAAVLDGKQIFLDQKCNMCHTVSSAGITPTSKIKAPDLTGLAAKEDAAWIGKFLRKEADKNGKKHIKPFTGSDEELGAVIAWLQKQTKAEKK
jgi:mono/diheme cytochrome c family protein